MIVTRRKFMALGIAVLCTGPAAAVSDDEVVLVTNEQDPDFSLSTLDLRKLFLGFTLLHDGHALQPIRNRSDERLDQVFLQYVMAMSADAYERRLLSWSLQQGRPRPREVKSKDEFGEVLHNTRHGVSFAWRSDLDGVTGVHVVKVLWRP